MTGHDHPSSVPAGWYADPGRSGGWRYWDGAAWTSHTAGVTNPQQATSPTSAPPPATSGAMTSESPSVREGRRGSRRGVWLVVAVLVAAPVVGLGLGFVLGGWDEDPYLAGGLSEESDVDTEPAADRDADRGDSNSAPQPAERRDAPDDAPAQRRAEQDESAATSATDLEEAFVDYIRSLDSGDIDRAYAHVSPSLRRQDGWSRERFTTFREEVITGCQIVHIDDVSAASRRVEATVDFDLPDGAVSREAVRTQFVRGADGDLLLDDYEVMGSERLD